MNVSDLGRCPLRAEQVVEQLTEAKKQNKLEQEVLTIFQGYEMDMYIIWSCRSFLRELSDDFYKKNSSMIFFYVIIEAMAGNISKIERMIPQINSNYLHKDSSNFTPYDFAQIIFELVLPQLSNEEFIQRVRFLSAYMPEPIGGLALNACRPSVINGFRDLTEYCPNMESARKKIEHSIYIMYGKSGKGIYEVALAEWKYETNKIFDALMLVAGTIPTLEGADDIRCQFVAYILQMRILFLNGQAKFDKNLFVKISEKIREKHFEELEMTLHASMAHYACYRGDLDKINDWLKNEAPDENDELYLMGMYSYFVKMRCYLQTDRYMLTLLLSKRLVELLKLSYRPHDLCLCYILSAMACLKAGNEDLAMDEFEKALEIGIPHGYIRVFADEGQMMLDLINVYYARVNKQGKTDIPYDKRILKSIKSIALEIARRFPYYLESPKDSYNELTPTERSVLLLMADGLSNDAIADKLGKKTGTIKYHSSNIFKKLKVENRQQAVNAARNLGVV